MRGPALSKALRGTLTRSAQSSRCASRLQAVYASRATSPPPMQDSLPAGGLRLYREGVEPSGPLRKVSGHISIPLSRALPVASRICSKTHSKTGRAHFHIFSVRAPSDARRFGGARASEIA